MFRPVFRGGVVFLACSMAVAVGTRPAAQQPAGQPQFRAGVELVAIDFLALDSDGRPVLDLRQDEVAIRIDGRGRTVQSLQLVRTGRVAAEGSATALAPPAPFGSNLLTEMGRDVFIVLDNDSFRPGREGPLRDAVNRFLGTLSVGDRVALFTMPYGGTVVDLTGDFTRIRQALAGIAGQAPSTETGSEAACRTRRTLQSLVGLLGGLRGRESPLTVIFVSSGLMGPRRDAPVTLAPGMCEILMEEFTRVGQAAAVARSQFYVIQPENIMDRRGAASESIAGSGFIGSDNPLEGLEHLTSVTGGRMLNIGTSTSETALDRVARETSAHYLVGFVPEGADRNGENHRLDVRVSRPGVTVRVRPDIDIPRPAARPAGPTAVTPADMIRDARIFRDLPLRVAGYASRGAGGSINIVAVAEAAETDVTLAGASMAVFDKDGRLVGQWTATAGDLAQSPLMTAFAAPPGSYRLRVAATDATGRGGSADYDVVAELTTAGSLRLSGLVLGVSRPSGFLPRLQFRTEAAAIAYLEFYGGQAGAAVSVVFEVATSVDGPAFVAVPGAVAATGDPDRFQATAAIPVGALPPGDFVVRGVVGLQDQAEGQVVRTIRKIAR